LKKVDVQAIGRTIHESLSVAELAGYRLQTMLEPAQGASVEAEIVRVTEADTRREPSEDTEDLPTR
jgi:hypothetical protein